jgi:multimeric flavodoxin WrbA
MKNILILDAGLKPGWTKSTADALEKELVGSGSFAIERINLRDEQIGLCQGCALCLDRGEIKCRNHSDSAVKILGKMEWADGILTVTPNYSLQVPWILKNLYDRLAFVFHRPRLFHKVSMAVVVQGVYGGGKILDYIDSLMSFWGCSTVKGAVVTGALYPNGKLDEAVASKNEKAMGAALKRFTDRILHFKAERPTLFKLAIFRMTRSSMKHSPEALPADKSYYEKNGWMDSRYYYKVGLGPVHAALGAMLDGMIKNMVNGKKQKMKP